MIKKPSPKKTSTVAKHREGGELHLQSRSMISVINDARILSKLGDPVLVVGETGVGKELIARMIHYDSGRKGKLVVVNSYDFEGNPALAHSEIFGHEKGAFTDANKKRLGAVAEAEDGTLFIDEIGSLPTQVQGQVLRLIENQEYRRLGSDTTERTNCRIVAASNKVTEERFGLEKDVYWRFPFHLEVPPLKDRRDDLIDLFFWFCDELDGNHRIESVPYAVAHILLLYEWPGNVRELKNRVKWFVQVDRAKQLQVVQRYLPSITQLREHHHPGVVETYYTWFFSQPDYFKKMCSMEWIAADIGVFPIYWLLFRVERKELIEFVHNEKRIAYRALGLSDRQQSIKFLIEQAHKAAKSKRIQGLMEAVTTDKKNPLELGTMLGNLDFMARFVGADWARDSANHELSKSDSSLQSATESPGSVIVGADWSKDRIQKEIALNRIEFFHGNKSAAAKSLMIDRMTLSKWIK